MPKHNPPSCTGHYDYFGEFDCNCAHEETCEGCLSNWYNTGGLYDPRSGKRWNVKKARKAFGIKPIFQIVNDCLQFKTGDK